MLRAFIASLALASCQPEPASEVPNPGDPWLATVGDRIDAASYRFEPEGAGFAVRNPAQALEARFDGGGVRVAGPEEGAESVGIALVAWGAGEADRELGAPAWALGGCDDSGRLDPTGE